MSESRASESEAGEKLPAAGTTADLPLLDLAHQAESDAVPDVVPEQTGERSQAVAEAGAAANPAETSGVTLPDKEFFKIGEVARIVGVKPYVLRYWEGEFKRNIRPSRTRSNQRMYRRRDVETFLEIKRLRYDEKLELSGARKRLGREQREARERSAEKTGGDQASGAFQPRSLNSLDSPDSLESLESRQSGAPSLAVAGIPDGRLERVRSGLENIIRIVDEDEPHG